MRTIFQRLFSPSEEPSRDPYLFMHAAVEAEPKTVEPPLTLWGLICEVSDQVMRCLSPRMELSEGHEDSRRLAKSWCRKNGKHAAAEVAARRDSLYGDRPSKLPKGVLTVAQWQRHDEEAV